MRLLSILLLISVLIISTSLARSPRRKEKKSSSTNEDERDKSKSSGKSKDDDFSDRNSIDQGMKKRVRKGRHKGMRPRLSDGVSKMLKSYRGKIWERMKKRLRMNDQVYKKVDVSKVIASRIEDETEIKSNAEIAENLLEGDIIPTQAQMDVLMSREEEGERRKRKAISGSESRWPTTIKYAFDGQSTSNQAKIKKGIDLWQSETCIDFKEFGELQSDGILFIEGDGCFSNVGRVEYETEQIISIGTLCYRMGIVTHEIGHALGLWHEQGRPDRDEFINVIFDEVIPDYIENFEKRPPGDVVDSGVDYDYGSVMHYGGGAFSKTLTGLTLKTKDPNYQKTIGQRSEGPTFLDIKAINRVYCSDICKEPLECKHKGYPDPRDCSKCKCPKGTAGKLCDEVEPSLKNCGGVLTANSEWQTVTYGSRFSEHYCVWLIKAPKEHEIRLELKKLMYRERETCSSYLEVKTSNFHQTGARFCVEGDEFKPLKSEGGEVLVIHKGTLTSLKLSDKLEFRFKAESEELTEQPKEVGSTKLPVPATTAPEIVQTTTPKSTTPKPTTPKPTTSKPTTPKSTTPKPTSPKPTTPKPTTTKTTTTKSTTPKPTSTETTTQKPITTKAPMKTTTNTLPAITTIITTKPVTVKIRSKPVLEKSAESSESTGSESSSESSDSRESESSETVWRPLRPLLPNRLLPNEKGNKKKKEKKGKWKWIDWKRKYGSRGVRND